MWDFIVELLNKGNGWARTIVALIIGSFLAGMFYTNIMWRLTNLEKSVSVLQEVQKSINNIESVLKSKGE